MSLPSQLGAVEIITHWLFRPTAWTEIYKCPFFPQIIRNLNVLPDSNITSAEGVADGVARFTSLMAARD